MKTKEQMALQKIWDDCRVAVATGRMIRHQIMLNRPQDNDINLQIGLLEQRITKILDDNEPNRSDALLIRELMEKIVEQGRVGLDRELAERPSNVLMFPKK